MARLPTPGADIGTWGDILNDYLSVSHNSDGTLKDSVFNVKTYGALGDGVTDDTLAIQGAINAAKTAGGGIIYFPANTFLITAALIINGSATVSIELRGSSLQTTIINQSTTGADILVFGTTDIATGAQFMRVEGMKLNGGRYAIRLNNALHGTFEQLLLNNNNVGIYMEGQNEGHHFRDIHIVGSSNYGILTGQTNGGLVSGVNYPIFQKCVFDHFRIASCTSSTNSMKLTAGIYNGAQQSSGYSIFRHFRLEGNQNNEIDCTYLIHTIFEQISNEASTLSSANTFSIFKEGTSCASICIRNSNLVGRANDAVTYKYAIEQVGGTLTIDDVHISPAAGTADIQISGIQANILNCEVTGTTTGIVFGSTAARSKSLIFGTVNGSGIPYTNWGANIPFLSSDINGLVTGPISIGAGSTIIKHLTGTDTWNPSNLTNGSSETKTVTVTGATTGDTVTVGLTTITGAGWQISGQVTSANTVTVTLTNQTGGTVDLASGTIRADVWQH